MLLQLAGHPAFNQIPLHSANNCYVYFHTCGSALEMVSKDLEDPRTILRTLLSAGYQPVAKPHVLEDQGFYSGFYSLRHVAYHG